MKPKVFTHSLIFILFTLLGIGATFGQEPEEYADGLESFPPGMDALGLGVMLGAVVIGTAIAIGICAVIAYLIIQNYRAIPAEHRTMEPGKVWLILIPVFNLYWMFPVFLGLADSYKSYFNSIGDESVGDCNRQLSLWYCISACCAVIPCVNYLAGPASLVLLIIVLVRASDLKKKVVASAA